MMKHLNQPARAADLAATNFSSSHSLTPFKPVNLKIPARNRARRKTSLPVGRFRLPDGPAEWFGKFSRTFKTASRFGDAYNHQNEYES
jgi:hypothetical protein